MKVCCHCLTVDNFLFCFSLSAGSIFIGWYLSLEAFLLLIASIAWVSDKKKYEGGDPIEKSIYGLGGFWLLGTSIIIIIGVGKSKPVLLKSASVLMVVPIVALAVDSAFTCIEQGGGKIYANFIPLILMPYFMIILCSKAAELYEERRGYCSGRDVEMETL